MKQPHWRYFVALCDDLEKTVRFVEPHPDNFRAYSIEYAHLYLATGSEIDVVAKVLCDRIAHASKPKNINDYRAVILPKYPDLPDVEIAMPRMGIQLTPWADWRRGKNPDWWEHYNGVKHQRNHNFKHANLENTLNALAGLLVLIGYVYNEDLRDCKLATSGNLLQFDRKYHAGIAITLHGNVAGYCLPGVPRRKLPGSKQTSVRPSP